MCSSDLACSAPHSGVLCEAFSGNGSRTGGSYDGVSLHSSDWNGAWNVWREDIGIYAAEDSQDHDIAEQTKESG